VSKVVGEEPLTVRQEQVLVAALESGYFDYPRKVRLSELAKRLNISPSTLDEVLRRAERNVLLKYIQGR
jgi:predicted DNA binding protein